MNLGSLIWQFIKWHKVLGDKLAIKLFDRPLPPATERELALGTALQIELSNPSAPSVLPKWTTFREEIRRNFNAYDPRSFLRWPLIQHTMCVTNSGVLVRELFGLRTSPNWPRFQRAIKESPIGQPIPCIYHPRSSGNLLHHAYHLMRFEEFTGTDVAQLDLIVEFGGGYGSMCRLIHQLGFKGRYIIYDLPEFTALQRYFLQCLRLPIQTTSNSPLANGIHLISDFDQLKTILAPTPQTTASAVIGTWSLSEAPFELRDRFLDLVAEFNYFLIAFQDRFFNADNHAYFAQFANTSAESIDWLKKPLRHLPGNNYLFGKRHA